MLGLPKFSCINGVCIYCVIGKQRQDPFPKGKSLHATTRLELVHSDLISFLTCSFLGLKFSLNLNNEFSHNPWVHFLKYLSDVFVTFKIFKVVFRSNPLFLLKNYTQIIGGVYESGIQGFL